MLFVIAFISALGFLPSAHAESIIPGSPPPEMSRFAAEWCGSNSRASEEPLFIVEACYGHVRFRDIVTVRALEFKAYNGQKFVYVDAEFGGVDLLRLEITLVGPLFVFVPEKLDSSEIIEFDNMELGRAFFYIDENGEVFAFKSFTVRTNEVFAIR